MTTRTDDLTQLTVAQLGRRIQRKSVSPVEVARAFVQRIEQLEPRVGAFITQTTEQALDAAREAESQIARGAYKGPLHGIPFATKDLYWTAGVRTTSGSLLDADFVPDTDATAVRKLQEAGAYSIGKVKTTEFAFDPTGRNAHYGIPENPWKPGRLPGGSSAGSAAAVAAGFAPLALGSDTGGSIRLPSAFCGLTGLKPTFGLVSRHGVNLLSWSLDHAGPMARTAQDVAIAMNALAGHDSLDPYSANQPRHDYMREIDGGIRGVRIGVPRAWIGEMVRPEVEAAFDKSIDELRRLGAFISEVHIPELATANAIAGTIITAEAVALYGRRLRSDFDKFDRAVGIRMLSGFFMPAPSYPHAMRARVVLGRALKCVYQQVDLLATPASWTPAPPIDQLMVTWDGREMAIRDTFNRMLRVFNVVGLPAATMPNGFSAEGLPLSLQLVGRPFEDALVLRAAHAYQGATDWHTRRPPL
ncbi:MAG: amidase [SAR202 cluster bacterium]|nr:amidase [SAR202 cluster bacterium]